MGKLNLNFSYSFNGKIWNIISHHEKELLLLEVREDEKFQVHYNLLNTRTGQFVLEGLTFEESWWIGAASLTGNIILFYTFPDQDNPDVKDVFAYDFQLKKVLWKKEHQNIIDVAGGKAWLMDEDGETATCYNLLTGDSLKMNESSIISANGKGEVENKFLKKPFNYREGSDYFNTVSQFLAASVSLHIVKSVDYYEDDQVLIMSFYYPNKNNKLANDLLAVDHNGNHLLMEKLGDNLNGISDDTFFIYDNKLIFVKDNVNFFIYQLN
ncbi:DUF4905 domain-containing protein [Fulvivirga sp. 29W222]|uniref:DUF4905 domain-containing protein n=1 Tax=Fulvivirga marina TaxID=2494733 RepID=A0A937FTP5_9BACT|nr:DUF4905 domain-containing protein [Fulvivirga marina]MBL6445524.1 DUF4905 domain-containing protein [Fulvivirga marina]